MLTAILIVLILILMMLVAMAANLFLKPDRRSPKEWAEDRALQKSVRAEKRASDKEELRKKELMRKVEDFDGTIR